MKNIMSAIVVVVCIIVGGIGGNFLKNGSGASSGDAAHDTPSKDKSHGAEKKGGHGAEPADKKDSHGAKDSHGSLATGGVDYFKFSREFVVPVMRESRVESLVILNINLEVDSSVSSKLFAMEPKVRDNIMTTLVELSNDGSTLEAIANLENYESIRATVLLNLQRIVPEGIRNVLIVDMAKQQL
jgi:hypothetical protein